jgi:predicted kinase
MKSFKSWLLEVVTQEEFGEENNSSKKEMVVLVGPPAVGKSTFIKSKFPPGDVFLVSRDDIVDDVAGSLGMTYDDMFEMPPESSAIGSMVPGKEKFGVVLAAPQWMRWTTKVYSKIQEANNSINGRLEERFKRAVDSGKHVVVDMTNMTVGARRGALKYIHGKDFFRRAVVFTLQESDIPELLRRMRSRSDQIKANGGSKTIGDDVVARMIKSFQKIGPEEGFDKVDTFNSFSP